MALANIVAKLPWKEIVKAAPVILTAAERLLRKRSTGQGAPMNLASDSQGRAPAALAKRLDALEQSEAEQAELVREMAEQIKQLTDAARIVSMRVNLALGGVFALAVSVAWLVVVRAAR